MNNARRKAIKVLIDRLQPLADILDEVREEVEGIRDEEQEVFDAMPESLQIGKRGQAAQESADNLETAAGGLSDIDLQGVIEALELGGCLMRPDPTLTEYRKTLALLELKGAVTAVLSGKRHPLGMYGVLMDGERAKGATILPVGCALPVAISPADWDPHSVFSRIGDDIRIVAVMANEIGAGALGRLVKAIVAAGLTPVIVEPVGLIMPAILRHWGWRRKVIGYGFERVEEWRAPRRLASRAQQGAV